MFLVAVTSVIKTLAEKKHAGSSSRNLSHIKESGSFNLNHYPPRSTLLPKLNRQSRAWHSKFKHVSTGWSLHVRQSACPAVAARKNPAGQQLCKWPSKNWQARESPNPKQMPVTSNVTRSLEIHNSKNTNHNITGEIKFTANILHGPNSWLRIQLQNRETPNMAESWEAYVPRRQEEEEEEVMLPNWCLIKCLQSSAAATDGDLVSWPIIHQLFLMSIVKKRKNLRFPSPRLSLSHRQRLVPGLIYLF